MHMLTSKPSSYYTGLGKIRFANPLYLKKAQKEKPCLYNVKYNKNDLANLFAPESDETIRLVEGSRSKSKKPHVEPISARKPPRKVKQSIATPHKKTVTSESTIQKSKSYFRMLYANTSKVWTWWIEKQCPSGYKWMPKTKKKWVPKIWTENVSTSISLTIDIASKITNESSLTHDLGSTLSNAPLSSSSLVDSSNHPIHC
ncbi:hypothetical protein Tco_0289498 [Tanacetum coccineum]